MTTRDPVYSDAFQDVEELEHVRKSAEEGHADAQFGFGAVCHARGDRSRAIEWWTKAGEQAHLPAMHELGKAYSCAPTPKDLHENIVGGKVVSQGDAESAVLWWGRALLMSDDPATKASKERVYVGNAFAFLGIACFHGFGVEKDRKRGIELLKSGVGCADLDALYFLDLFNHG